MDEIKPAQAADAADETPKKTGRKKSEQINIGDVATGELFKKKSAFEKRWLDMFGYLNTAEVVNGKKVIFVNIDDPLEGRELCPGKTSPLCAQCAMDTLGSYSPYMEPYGSENPLVTIITERVVQSQDDYGKQIVPANERVAGANTIYRFLSAKMDKIGIDPDKDVRWLSITRCAVRGCKQPNLSTKAQWCRYHAVQDLRLHPPKLIMPFGTVPLGALSHKSNATTWQGKILTYRGWPDDWLMEPKFMLPRPSMHGDERRFTGHPLFGTLNTSRTLLFPLQSPAFIYAMQNPRLRERWEEDILRGLELAKSGVEPLDYILSHYHITTDPDEVADTMRHLSHEIPGTQISFDTETTGLKAFAKGSKIVFMMFRWDDPKTGEPRSIGFPWDFPTSEIQPYIDELTPYVLDALYASVQAGHNLTFDQLFVAATLKGCDINRLAPQALYDTWHMAYTSKQDRGRLGLERITYDYAPHLAGYEEDMTLLIQLHADLLDPAAGQGGHYAMCPKDKWETHLKPYVMGDVETVHCARKELQKKLDTRKTYAIPLADPKEPGRFRFFTPPSRAWLYSNIISPASRMLTKMMSRGMYIDEGTLKKFETDYPNALVEQKQKISTQYPQIAEWIAQREAETREAGDQKDWEFDLDNKNVIRDLLFGHLDLPIQRLTKEGRKQYPEPEDVARLSRSDQLKWAAVDKFTLNKLAADHEIARPLIDYRRLFKLYTTYVRPLRNHFDERVDKKERTKEPHLWMPDDGGDGCLHASFMLTGTRGGRLCVAGDTQLEVKINGIKKLVAISDLWKYNNQHVTVKTHLGRWRKITKLYFKGYEHMLEAVTESGCSIKATVQHRIYSSRGWRSLGDIIGQDLKLCVGMASEFGDGNRRAQPATSRIRKENEFSANKRGNFAPRGFTKLESVSGAKAPAYGVALGAIGGCSKGQQERTAITLGDFAKKTPGDSNFTWNTYREHCQGDGNDSVFSRTEYPGIWVAEIGQCTGSGQSTDGSNTITNRSVLSGFNESLCDLFVGQREFFQKSLSSLRDTVSTGLVLKRHVPNAFYTVERGHGRYGRDFMVDEPARVGTFPGIDFFGDSSLPRVCLQRQSASGFRTDWHEFAGGNRWRIPHGCSERGLHKTGRSLGLSDYSFHDQAGAIQNVGGDCRNTGGFETIICWRSIGVQAVWDIEVEEDHSYLAQGLFHHNSCRDPNLQQLPSDSDIKKMFKSRFGKRGCMYSGDLSQIELRLLAAACGDPNMLKAYYDNLDLHTLTTSRIFKLPYDIFTKQHMEKLQQQGKGEEAKQLDLKRRIGKTCNFLTGYGGGAFGLQTTLANSRIYLPIEECEDILESFFESYPTLRKYLGQYKEFILETGVAVSLMGRVRIFDEVDSNDNEQRSKALRAGCNHLIQATASDMMLLCLCVIEDTMREQNLESMLVSTVHDSLVVDAIQEELPVVHDIVYTVVNSIPDIMRMMFGDNFDTSWMIVPFAGDCEVGLDYKNQNKIPEKGQIDWDRLLRAA